jgi:hypothetical protein
MNVLLELEAMDDTLLDLKGCTGQDVAHEKDLCVLSMMPHVPPSLPVKQSDRPTLSQMMDNGTRVVVFLDAGADGADAVNFISQMVRNPFFVSFLSFRPLANLTPRHAQTPAPS